MNVPLSPGTGNTGYAHAFETIVEPVVAEFDPDLILCSAGGDAGPVDPIGRNLLTTKGFANIGARVRELAAEHTAGALALVQEDGYSVSHVGYAMLATIQGVLGKPPVDDPFAWMDEDPGPILDAIDVVAEAHEDVRGS